MPHNASLHISHATKADIPTIVAMFADDVFGANREDTSDAGRAVYERAFDAMQAQSGNRILIAEDDNGIAGCLQLTIIHGLSLKGTTRALIEGVRVHSDRRGQGIGEWVLRQAIAIAKAEGCTLVQLTTNHARKDAHRFYEKLGFVGSHLGMKLVLE